MVQYLDNSNKYFIRKFINFKNQFYSIYFITIITMDNIFRSNNISMIQIIIK